MSGGEQAILVVEDESDVRWALAISVVPTGHRAVCEEDGHAAIESLDRHRFVLALVDAKLPDIDGADLADAIQQRRPGLPVVLISGYFHREDPDISRWLASRTIDAFLSKPFKIREVREIVQQLALHPTP